MSASNLNIKEHGPRNEDWREISQALTFVLVSYEAEFFSGLPVIDAVKGNLVFTTEPLVSGMTTLTFVSR